MANSFQDLSQLLVPLKDTFPPQLLSATGNGNSINCADVGVNRINARLHVGDATALTSLDVKMQAAPDDGTGAAGTFADIDGATFTQVTTDGGAAGLTPETISFQLPAADAAVNGGRPYQWVRAVATLVGTSINICVSLEACAKDDGGTLYVSGPGDAGSEIIN